MVVGRTFVKGGPLPAWNPDASLLARLGRKGHTHDGARFPRMALVRSKLRRAEHDLAAVLLFAASPAQGFPTLCIHASPSVRRFHPLLFFYIRLSPRLGFQQSYESPLSSTNSKADGMDQPILANDSKRAMRGPLPWRQFPE